MATTQPIRSKHQVKQLVDYYLNKDQIRNYVLVTLSIHTALRIGDLLSLRWDDVYDFGRKQVRDCIHITESKTKKPKTIALNKAIVRALSLYAATATAKGKPVIERL